MNVVLHAEDDCYVINILSCLYDQRVSYIKQKIILRVKHNALNEFSAFVTISFLSTIDDKRISYEFLENLPFLCVPNVPEVSPNIAIDFKDFCLVSRRFCKIGELILYTCQIFHEIVLIDVYRSVK